MKSVLVHALLEPPAASIHSSNALLGARLRAHEHEVLEEVREAGPPRLLVLRAHAVDEVGGDLGQQ